MNKVDFLNKIEQHYGFQFNKSQLQFFFLENKFTVMSSPKRGGKTLIASMDALYTCTNVNKTVCLIAPNKEEKQLIYNYITKMVIALKSGLSINRMTSDGIYFNNNSSLLIKSPDYMFRGYRFDKAIIVEPDLVTEDIQKLIDYQLLPCLAVNANSQLKLIGTHKKGCFNLIAYMMNPYYEKIQMTYQQSHLSYTNEEQEDYVNNNGMTSFKLEVLNEITPYVFDDMFERRE